MPMIGAERPNKITATAREDLAGAVSLFHSLADPTRLAILQRLATSE